MQAEVIFHQHLLRIVIEQVDSYIFAGKYIERGSATSIFAVFFLDLLFIVL